MPHIPRSESLGRDASDRDRAAPSGDVGEKGCARLDLASGRSAVRGLGPGVRRHDVPEQHLVLDAELGEDAMDDRCGRLGRAGAGQLALGREGDPADPRAAVAGRLADEDDLCAGSCLEVRAETAAEKRRRRVLVVRIADHRGGEPVDEVGTQAQARTYSHSIVAGGFDVTSSTTRFSPGISFTMRAEIVSTRSYGSLAQSAVIASSLVTARITIG